MNLNQPNLPASGRDTTLPIFPAGTAIGEYTAELARIRATVRKLNQPVTLDQFRILTEIGTPDATRLADESLQLAAQRIATGRRLSAEQLEALRLQSPRDFDAYHAASRAKTSAERVALHTARKSDIGELPPCADPVTRTDCADDLVRFGTHYCAELLRRPPAPRIAEVLASLAAVIRNGGRLHLRLPRGKGKSTWVKIALLWSLLYGYRRFAVVFSANAVNAKAIIRDICRLLEHSPRFLADFPEVAVAFRALGGVTQRCAAQTYRGRRTEIAISSENIRLPVIEDSPASGALIVSRGLAAGVRGLIDMATRPDFVFLDDPQTSAKARSPRATETQESLVTQDILGLGGHDQNISAILATTPLCHSDLSERFADTSRHPEWVTHTLPLVLQMPTETDLWEEFAQKYNQDQRAGRFDNPTSTAFYAANRAAMDEGAVLLDPGDAAPGELSSLHHAMLIRCKFGPEAFRSEYQMAIRQASALYTLDPARLASRLTQSPILQLPQQCNRLFAFCDVNAAADAALRWCVLAVGDRNTTAIVAYGRHPQRGRLYPEHTPADAVANAIANGLAHITATLETLPFHRHDGAPAALEALCFDGGWQTTAVAAFTQAVRAPFRVIWSKGFGFRNYKQKMALGDPGHFCHLSESRDNGFFLAIHVDYWREYAQRTFYASPLQPGSCAFYGSDPEAHGHFAAEVAAEQLQDKGISDRGFDFWQWHITGPNHYGDTLTGCFALASYYKALSPPTGLAAPAPITPAAAPRPRRQPRYKFK